MENEETYKATQSYLINMLMQKIKYIIPKHPLERLKTFRKNIQKEKIKHGALKGFFITKINIKELNSIISKLEESEDW